MATIGSVLTAPESGWRRIDNTDSNISYVGTFTYYTDTNAYGGSYKSTTTIGSKIQFNFTGTRLRVISGAYTSRSNNITIKIDDVSYSFSEYLGTATYKVLVYEKTGLVDKEHYVEIISNDTKMMELDALDIDSIGELKPYKGINTKYLIQDKNSILWNYDGSVLNKINGSLTEEVAINKGISDYTILNNKTITKIGLDGVDKGAIGVGKQFEISLDNSLNTINSIV